MRTMSDHEPKPDKAPELPDERTIEHAEKSITGSGQALGQEPSEDFVAPTMALDSIEPDSDG
jgi:hypothetical protein